MGRLWNKDESEVNEEALKYTIGKDYILDERLIKYDCLCSIAHAKMLHKIGILENNELNQIIKALNEIIKLNSSGSFKVEWKDEDIHTKIENYLTDKLGETGKKIHTARSRNDQVLCALRLYYKDELQTINELSINLKNSLKKLVEKYGNVKIPGFTHTRKAMVSSIKLWAGSFVEAIEDDIKFGKSVLELIDKSPLGTGAGYGIPVIKIDRNLTKRLLNFKRLQKNPIYVQNSRGKFEGVILSYLSMIMFDINKLSSDIIFFSEDDINIIKIPKQFTTGSSIMPHKKNPDVFEIARSKYSKIISLEIRTKTLPMNLISGYHRDFQEMKECIYEGFDTTKETLKIISDIIENLEVDKEKTKYLLSEDLFSTEEVYKLVKKGIPFRDAYKIIGKKYTQST